MPCGNANNPAPKLRTSLPDWSNSRIGSSVDILPVAGSATQLFVPHRSATQIERPSRATSTALVDPQVRPSGSLKKFSTVWYGVGASLVGVASDWADIAHPPSNTMARMSAYFMPRTRDMPTPSTVGELVSERVGELPVSRLTNSLTLQFTNSTLGLIAVRTAAPLPMELGVGRLCRQPKLQISGNISPQVRNVDPMRSLVRTGCVHADTRHRGPPVE